MIEAKEVISEKGAVAVGAKRAAQIGVQMLERGGNAMDAAAAACLATCMLEPHFVDVGGYVACAVVLEPKSDRVWSLDANSTAPAAARPDMYQLIPDAEGEPGINETEYGCHVKGNANVVGPLATGVPGTMAGIGILWERWGQLKWPEIVAPSQKLLEEGISYGASLADAIKSKERVIRRFEPTVQHLMPEGRLPAAGDIWHRRDMEKTLQRIATAGWRDFYQGDLARKIADYVSSTGGMLTRKDMAEFQPRVTEPYATSFRGAPVYSAILPNGGLTSLQILNMMEAFQPAADDSVIYWHRLAEILKLAWRDRFRYLADPESSPVPVNRLLSKEYAAGRVETIRQFPDHIDTLAPAPSAAPPHGTVHLSAADAKGNLVSITFTQGGNFGSCVTVPGTGIILGHGMCRFDPRPGGPNSVGPRKRPLNNVAPLIVRLPDRDAGLGIAGGRRIVSVSATMAQRVVDFAASSYQAVAAPRIHLEGKEPVEISKSLSASIREKLKAMGHQLSAVASVGGVAGCAEVLKKEKKVRAGGNAQAVGVAKVE
ncbi:MAG TPA: gamma-glutamyltransferase [Acidobacteriota bacterium]|jgi:gamma-glutamyltranspeptidase/glutathione hydrolase|nr:gamma-glutamyltransferase [Acidobacteriota bacterium]